MLIGLHDAEQEHIRGKIFPNYALMKISAYHKARGGSVEWWNPLKHYDRIYSSKVFDFTPRNPYLPENTIRCGTGYADIPLDRTLPEAIDSCRYVYSGRYKQESWAQYLKRHRELGGKRNAG